jgi:tetratricopeptide (TPR) repeat protein/tRNA A-37 threonylcarbamoyl transferase component Bud32
MVDDSPSSGTSTGSISRFTILEVLGEGAMGVVYRARDAMLGRDVALKLIRPELAAEPRNRSRFLRECRAAAALNHPGVATIYEAGETGDGQLYLASELVAGETLQDRLERDGAMSPEEVVAVGIQLADALEAAHSRGAIHRDIKPSNLMLTADGRLKVLDFGLARLVQADGTDSGDDRRTVDQTQEGAVVGTPAYMSPEQASGMTVDARTDVFSAGCVLYELATGVSPFRSATVPETLRRVLCEEPPSIVSSVDGVPDGLETVLRGALTKDRDGRIASAAELAAGLRALRDEPISVRPRFSARRRALLGGVAGLLVAVAAAALVWQWSRPGLAFASRDRLLVADVDNRTGEETFDLALHLALEADLKQSPYASLFQRHQVEQTLNLMRRSPDSRVDEALGRDVCRFAGVRALILPRILRAGDAYELQAIVVDPQTGRHVEQIRVSADGRDELLLDAIDRLTRELRTRLGESLESIERADFPVAMATTASWEAMHYFALGSDEWGRGNSTEAVRLYRLALDLDPEFATCRGSLGLLLIQVGLDPARGREELSRALADGETLPRNEYLMLRAASRHFVDGDLEGALGEYELINSIYPGNMAAYNNRGRILTALGRTDEAVAMYEKAAELDRQNAFPLINLSFLYLINAPDAAKAEEVGRKLVALDPEVANYHSMLGWALAVQLRFDEAREVLQRALELEPDHPYAVPNMGYTMMAAGNPSGAVLYLRRNLARIRDSGDRPGERGAVVDLAVALRAAGDPDGARAVAVAAVESFLESRGGEAPTPNDHTYLAQLHAVAGQTVEAEEQLQLARSAELTHGDDRIDLARCCALLDRRECAVEETRRAVEMGVSDPFLPMLLPAMHDLLGDPEFMALFPGHGAAEAGPESSG